MLRITDISLVEGIRIRLPELWHEKLVAFCKDLSMPYEYEVERIVKNNTRNHEDLCICSGERLNQIGERRIIIRESVIKYLLAEEVIDDNSGFLFTDYLPPENSEILITNLVNPNVVIPGVFKISCKIIPVYKTAIEGIGFVIDFLNGDGFTSLDYFCSGINVATWKLIRNPDTSHMTDYEKMFQETIIHKDYVIKSCEKLARYLERTGAINHANKLRERGLVHDNSKITCEDELYALSKIINDKEGLRNPAKKMTPMNEEAIKLHWQNNSHHPEHYKSSTDMTRLDVMEMCCDWHARSIQYGTDFLEFVKERQKNRFHFPDWMFSEIWHYCEVLAGPSL